jgi:hypothetical protein
VSDALVPAIALAGLVGGLLLLGRGLAAYRAAHRVAGIATSRTTTLAAGEVRLVGAIEPDVHTLVSPLQSVPCVYYRARIRVGRGGDAREILDDERAVGFRLRDASGSIRVFPRGARWDAPLRYDAADGWAGDPPPDLRLNRGPAHQSVAEDRDAQIAALLSVRPAGDPGIDEAGNPGGILGGGTAFGESRRRDYEERRLEPGDIVTVLATALPFGDLADPATADRHDGSVPIDDPEVALNLAEARAAGILRATPEEAWGNAAIPGFGIGRPARRPELDPDADVPPLAEPAAVAEAEARFEIPPGELVLAASPDHPLAILAGTPGEAQARESGRVLVGLAGAGLAIASAVVLALYGQGALR